MMEEEIITPEEETFDYHKLRYILDKDNYVCHASLGGLVVCDLGECTEYIGDIPKGYETIEEWFEEELERINAWKIVENNLVFDENKYNELQAKWEIEAEENASATHKYVNDKLNEVNSVLVDELSTSAEDNTIIKLVDSGDYNINNLKVYLDPSNKEIQLKITNGNLIKNEAVSQTINDVEITVNEDKTITLNGTASSDTEIVLCGTNKNTDMLFMIKSNIGYYQGGLIDGTSIILNSFDGTDKTEISNIGNGQINLNEDEVVTEVILKIANGATFSNAKIYPMLSISETPKQYIEAKTNDLIKIDLSSFTIKDGDYLEIKEEKISLVSGKKETDIQSITILKTFYPETYVMIDSSNNLSIDYFRYKYFTETINDIKNDVKGISLIVEENLQTTNTVSNTNILHLENAFAPSDLIELRIKGAMSLFFLGEHTYLGEDIFLLDSYLIHDKTELLTEKAIKYHLPFNYLLYMNENVFDEFVMTKDDCYVIRRVGENADGSLYELEYEKEESCEGFTIPMFEGDNYFYLEHFKEQGLILTATYEIKNNFSENYVKKATFEMTTDNINASISKKVGPNDVIASINMSPEEIKILAQKLNLEGYFTVNETFHIDKEGNMQCIGGTIGGFDIDTNALYSQAVGMISVPDDFNGYAFWAGADTTNIGGAPYRVTSDGTIYALGGMIIQDTSRYTNSNLEGVATSGTMSATNFVNASEEKLKENINKFSKSALDIIKNTDIYNYNYKKKKDKKIGVVIGESYNTPEEIISTDKDKNVKGIDLYSMTSLSWKANQELNEKFEKQQKIIDFLINKLDCKTELKKYLKGEK
jgi:hypothetical protein